MFQQFAVSYSYSNSWHFSFIQILLLILVALVLGILGIIGLWKVFEKAGKPGWAAIVPIYNTWTLFEIGGKPGWYSLVGLLGIIPLLGIIADIAAIVLYIMAMLEVAKRFGKSTVFAVFGLIIFSVVGFLMLGFGDATYHADGSAATGPTPADSKSPSSPTSPA